MGTPRENIPIWVILSLTMIPLTALSAVLASFTVDAFVIRPMPASVTTLLPGWTYAVASVMKVCLVAGGLSAAIALMKCLRRSRIPVLRQTSIEASGSPQDRTMNLANTSGKITPIWSLLSIAVPSLAPFIGALVVVTAQALMDKPEGLTIGDLSLISRTSVLIMLAWIAAGTSLGVIGLLKRERPRSLGALGVITNAFLIGLFWYCQFYKLGFDQDRWAEP